MIATSLYLLALLPGHASQSPKVETDLPYVTGGGQRQRLDLYVPAQKGFATIVYLHEGSLRGGDKADQWYAPIAKHFQAEGYGFALINYRLLSDAKWPAPAEDCASAVAWVKDNIAVRGGDAKKIFLVGHSSGARLSALLATDATYLAAHNMKPNDLLGAVAMGTIMWIDFLEKYTDEQIKGFIATKDSFRQKYGGEEMLKSGWPMANVNKDQAPILCLIAEREQINPPILAQSQAFQKASKELGASVDIQVILDRTHMQNMQRMAEDHDPAFEAILKFIRSHGGASK